MCAMTEYDLDDELAFLNEDEDDIKSKKEVKIKNGNFNVPKKNENSERINAMLDKENVIRLILQKWNTMENSNGDNSHLGAASDKEEVLKIIIDKWKI